MFVYMAEKAGCHDLERVCPSMKMVIYKLSNCSSQAINSAEHEVEELEESNICLKFLIKKKIKI